MPDKTKDLSNRLNKWLVNTTPKKTKKRRVRIIKDEIASDPTPVAGPN